MSVTVRVPPVFRTLTSGTSQVSVDGATVGDVLDALEGAHPGFKDKLLDGDGKLVHSQDTDVLELGRGYDKPKFLDFLKKWGNK